MKKLFVLFVLGAAALTACGGDAPKPADPTSSTAGDPAAKAADATKGAPSATPATSAAPTDAPKK